ncbi:MAG TPA: DOMON-like domain-containing protein [Caulobacteraceae bacterium]|nr:DOMON-like domain-containing protein [Caulobacteraceae bacterium]
MTRALQLHPTSRCGAGIAVSVDARRPAPGVLSLAYAVAGDVGRLYVPAASEPLRTDDLWKRTCFEAFVLPGPGDAYVEFNFASSGRWATYRFDRYREGMRDAVDVVPAPIAVTKDAARLELAVSAALPDLAAAPVWRLGLTAVIEEADGHVSYWALAHPRPQPEFHDPAGFVLELAA